MITSLSVALPIKPACLGACHCSQWDLSHWVPWTSSSVFISSPIFFLLPLSLPLSWSVLNSFRDIFSDVNTQYLLLFNPTLKGRRDWSGQKSSYLLVLVLGVYFSCGTPGLIVFPSVWNPEEHLRNAGCWGAWSGNSECGKCSGSCWFSSSPSSAYSLA